MHTMRRVKQQLLFAQLSHTAWLSRSGYTRPPLPLWTGVDIPSTSDAAIAALSEKPSVYSALDVLPLLEQDVEAELMPPHMDLPPEQRPHKHFRFKNKADAAQVPTTQLHTPKT